VIELNPKVLSIIAVFVMLAIFAAYMIFLVYTWQQLQNDRGAAIAKVDKLLDRFPVSDAKRSE